MQEGVRKSDCIAGEKIARFHVTLEISLKTFKKSLTKNASVLRKKENLC